MYIKVTTNKAGQSYYHLVESYWENGKSRQRTLLSLGRTGEDRIEELVSAIRRHKEIFTILALAKTVNVEKTFILGPLLVLERLFETCGIDLLLRDLQAKHPRLSFDLRKMVFTMVASRFIRPRSKLKIYETCQDSLYPEVVEAPIELHQLYRTLDVLQAHKDEIEQRLFYHRRDLLNLTVDVVLYDLTTLRFESVREDLGDLRKFGYSKEMRTDCTQVVLGLLVSPDGIPLGFEVYPGNTFEGQTLTSIVDKMRQKFKVRRFIFVADRGLLSRRNLEVLRTAHGEFIVGMKLGVFKKRHAEFYDLHRFEAIDAEGTLAIYETEHEGDRCIITWSKVRAERDRQTRDDILAKIRRKLAKKKITAKTFVTNKTYQRYVKGLDENTRFVLNEHAIAEDATRDGFFGVLTNVTDKSAREIISNYKQLWIIEDAFGEIKGTLRSRPVFHWKDERIVGHLVVCFLSYLCEAHLTKALRDKRLMLDSRSIQSGIIKSRPLTVLEAMRELAEVRAIPVEVNSNVLWVRTDIAGNATKLLAAIGMKPPPKLLSIKKLQKPAGTNAARTPNSP